MPSLTRGPGLSELRPPAHRRIVSITDDGGLPSVRTAAPHGLPTGSTPAALVISGTPGGIYDGGPYDIAYTDAVTFALDSAAYSADATGGTWRHA